jgi:hypothetical protein
MPGATTHLRRALQAVRQKHIRVHASTALLTIDAPLSETAIKSRRLDGESEYFPKRGFCGVRKPGRFPSAIC